MKKKRLYLAAAALALLALTAGFVAAIVALLVIPTAVVSTVKPEETIRYE